MTVYALYWWEKSDPYNSVLDDVFPTEESARHTANSILVQEHILGVAVTRCQLTEFGMKAIKEVYNQEKKHPK